MASAAGGSDGGRDNRRSSRGKDKNPVGPKVDKPSKAWLTAQLRYLEATHEEYVAAGEEPPFSIESLRLRYSSAPTPPNPAATFNHPLLQKEKNPPVHSNVPPKDG